MAALCLAYCVLRHSRLHRGMSNARITNATRNLTMRLPLDVVNHAEELAAGGSLKPVIVAALRKAWELPEPDKRSDKAA